MEFLLVFSHIALFAVAGWCLGGIGTFFRRRIWPVIDVQRNFWTCMRLIRHGKLPLNAGEALALKVMMTNKRNGVSGMGQVQITIEMAVQSGVDNWQTFEKTDALWKDLLRRGLIRSFDGARWVEACREMMPMTYWMLTERGEKLQLAIERFQGVGGQC